MIQEAQTIAWVLQNPSEFWMLADNFKPDCFKTEPWSRLWPALLKGWKQHERWPALNELDLVLNGMGLEAATKVLAGTLLRTAFTTEVSSYTKEDIVRWLAVREFSSIGAELLKASDSKHTIQEQIDYQRERFDKLERIAVGEKSLGQVFNVTADTSSWFSHIEEGYKGTPKPTGVYRLDKKLRHGGVRPTIGLIVGPTGGAKTTLLMGCIGATTVRNGGRWVQYVLDDSEGDIRERWYQHILQRPLTLEDMTVPAQQALVARALQEKYDTTYPGQFIGINIEPDKFTPKEILRDLEGLQRRFIQEDLAFIKAGGFIPEGEIGQIDGVGIDTADQIKPSRTSKDSWYELGIMFSELSHIPKKIGAPLWLTVQSGQEGVGASQITVRNVGGSYSKAKPAKIILGVAQTVAQSQARTKVDPTSEWYLDNKQHMWAYNPQLDANLEWEPAYLCVVKNTMAEGRSGLVKNVMLPILIDFSTCRIIEDYSRPEELMRSDRKTLVEEREQQGLPPAGQSGKRGQK